MKLKLIGHDYKYAAEQSLLTLFPGCKPEYPEKKGSGDHITVRCSRGEKWTSMTTVINKDGKRGRSARTKFRIKRAPYPLSYLRRTRQQPLCRTFFECWA